MQIAKSEWTRWVSPTVIRSAALSWIGYLKAVLPKDAIKADGYLSLHQFWRSCPPHGHSRKRGGGRFDTGEGGGSCSDSVVFDGQRSPANGAREAQESDFTVEPILEVYGGRTKEFKIPALQRKREQSTSPQPHRKQSRTKEQLTHTIVNCQNVIISCHLTLDLNVALPSIKRGILTGLHAGRIKEFKENWALLTQDPWVLQTVQGFQLPLVAQPLQVTVPPQMQFALEQKNLISVEVQTMLEKQAITVVQPGQEGFISRMFLVPKKGGGYRPVVNLKALNRFIAEEHFKMEGFHMVKDLVKPHDWLAKIDLKDAYFLVPMDPNHYQFLQF